MITYAMLTEAGDMEINEDYMRHVELEGNHLFVLCDGLGGHGMGNVASKLVADVFADEFESYGPHEYYFRDAFKAAQERLLCVQEERRAKDKMRSTVVALAISKQHVQVGHVGDSRLYGFKRGKYRYRTLDHSVPQMLVLTKDIKEEEIRNHPDRCLLLRAMGNGKEGLRYEVSEPIKRGKFDSLLLCSDGFWELITEEQMCILLKQSKTAEEWLSRTSDVVRKKGEGRNMDNFSAIVIWDRK